MSRDIRSYFSTGTSKKPPQPAKVEVTPKIVKRKAVLISSDEEDVPATPKERATKRTSVHKKKRRISDSDEDVPNSKVSPTKNPNIDKLSQKSVVKRSAKQEPKKIVNVSSLFDSEITRVERPKSKKEPPPPSQLNDAALLDDDFDVSIADLDVDKIKETLHVSPAKTPKKDNGNVKCEFESPKKQTSIKTPTTDSNVNKRGTKKTALSDLGLSHLNDEEPKEPSTSPRETSKSARKRDLETSVLSDEERFERKRVAAVLYQKYKNRQSVLNPGCKEVPKGTPNCLAGLTFLVTGILESIDREEANILIKELGGKISSTVGKRLNYLVVGEEAGPKKLATAEELDIKILSEDGLFDLIREKSRKLDTNQNQTTKTGPKNTDDKKKKQNHADDNKSVKREVEEDRNDAKRKVHDEPEISVKKEKVEASPPKILNTGTKAFTSEPSRKFPTHSTAVAEENMAWVDKYKPANIKQIIGQQGAASNCVKLMNWLSKWYSNHDGKKKLQRPNPWAKNDDGSFYKAALLSGPPGVGKTTTATLVCKELGFDTVEFNASDTRSKKLLKEEVSELLSNKSLYGYFNGGKKAVSKNHVLIMDEVDGMAGNEDRGGIQEMIALIKDSSVPIICMCNDRNHQKMRSLVNYCYDLRFNKPRLEQIKGAMMSVCFKEKYKVAPAKLEEIIAATNNDIRQTLNHLSLLSAGKELELENKEGKDKTAKKDLKLGPWEVVRKVFSAEEHKNMSLDDKADLFFNDYSLGPLFVQQNYLSVLPKVPKPQVPHQVALAADSLSLGDMIDKRIRTNSAWSLLPSQAMFSSVMPGEYMAGHFTGQINFPGWLGKNSKSAKRKRLAQELHDHTRLRTSGSRLSIRLDYAPFLLDAIVRPLKANGLEGVSQALEVIKEYRLLREDLESLIELTSWPGKKNPMESIDGKIKAALTRAYNKEVLAYSYSAMAGVKKKRAEAQDELDAIDEGEEIGVVEVEDEEEEDKLENDALIKAKKRPAGKVTSKTDKETAKTESKKATAGTSKGRGGGSKSKK